MDYNDTYRRGPNAARTQNAFANQGVLQMQNSRLLLSATAIAASLIAAPALSQSYLEEIVVTATKRETTLQEVPVAVTVTSAETIEQAVILDILDLQTVVPSLRITQLQSSGNTNFLIRGFGNGANNPGIEPSVGVFVDGVYRSRSAASLSDLPNLERVEVLRGPQSTLFGKNASAGVISIVTALPDEEFGGSAEFIAGNFGQLALRGNITGPLTQNSGFTFSAGINQRDGFADNLVSGEEYNERDRWNVRGQLYFEPSDTVSLRFIGDYDEIDELCCGSGNISNGPTFPLIQAVGGNLVPENIFSRTAFFNYEPRNEIENSGLSAQLDWDFDGATFTSITAFRNVQRVEDFDADFTSAEILSINLGDTDIDTFTQEFRLSSTEGETFDWLLGAFYFDEDVSYNTELRFGADTRLYADLLAGGGTPGSLATLEAALGLPPVLFGNGQGVLETTGQTNEALSIFGQVDFYLSDQVTITLGANYTQDEKDAFVSQVNTDVFSSLDFVQIGFGQIFANLTMLPPTPANIAANPVAAGQAQALSMVPCSPTTGPACNPLLAQQQFQVFPPFVNFPNSVESGNTDDSDTTWTVRVAVDVTDEVNVYASASTGFKSSSWNLSRDSRPFPADIGALTTAGLNVTNLTPGTRFAAPEESTVYELGLKARYEHATINVAVFDQKIEGFQQNIFSGVGFNLSNAGKQSTFGIEFEGSVFPTESVQLNLAATWMDPKYDSFVNALGVNGLTDLSGAEPAGIHHLSLNFSSVWTHDFANGNSLFVRGEYLHEQKVQVVDNVPASVASREVDVVNASIGLSTDNGWDFMLWGRNLTDDEYLLSAFPSVFQDGSLSGYPNPPRTYGITARKHF